MANLNITPNPQIISVANAGEALNKDLRFLDFSAAGLNPEQAAWVEAEKQAAITSGAAVIIDNSWLTALEGKGAVVPPADPMGDKQTVYKFTPKELKGKRIALKTSLRFISVEQVIDGEKNWITSDSGSPQMRVSFELSTDDKTHVLYVSKSQLDNFLGRRTRPTTLVVEEFEGKESRTIPEIEDKVFKIGASQPTNSGIYYQKKGEGTWPLANADQAKNPDGATLRAKKQFEEFYASLTPEVQQSDYPEGYKSAHVFVTADGYRTEPGLRIKALRQGEIDVFLEKDNMTAKTQGAAAKIKAMQELEKHLLDAEAEDYDVIREHKSAAIADMFKNL